MRRGLEQGRPRGPRLEEAGLLLDTERFLQRAQSGDRTRPQGEWAGVWWFSVEPGAIGLTPLAGAGDGINHHAQDRLAQLTAGLAQRERPCAPALALGPRGAPGARAPHHGTAPGACRAVVGRCDALRTQEAPQRGPLALPASGPATGVIGPRLGAIAPGAPPGLPGAPRAARRRRFGPGAAGLSRGERPRAPGRPRRVAFCSPPERCGCDGPSRWGGAAP